MIDTTKYPSANPNKIFFIADSYLPEKSARVVKIAPPVYTNPFTKPTATGIRRGKAPPSLNLPR